jgi:hypothetical protein
MSSSLRSEALQKCSLSGDEAKFVYLDERAGRWQSAEIDRAKGEN